MARRGRPSFAVALGLIAVAALVIRVIYVLRVARHEPLGLDATWYTLVSGTIAHGDGFVAPGPFYSTGRAVATAGFPPLYPTFLAAATKVANGDLATFRAAGVAVGVVTVVLTGLIGRSLAGARVGLSAAALAAAFPSLIAVDGALMSETLSIPLLYGAVLVAMAAIDRPVWWRWAILGVLLGLTVLTRVDALITVLVLVGACALAVQGDLRRRVLVAGMSLGFVVLVVAPWVLRNVDRLDEPAVATISSSATIAGANCPSTYSRPLLGWWDIGCMDAERQTALGETRWTRETRREGIDYATGHLSRLPLVVAVRELRMLGLYHPLGQAKLEALEGRSESWQKLGWVAWLPVMVLGAFGLVLMVRIGRRAVPLLALLGSTLIVVAVSYGNQRFRTTVEPALLIAAALTLTRWIPALPRALGS